MTNKILEQILGYGIILPVKIAYATYQHSIAIYYSLNKTEFHWADGDLTGVSYVVPHNNREKDRPK